MGNPFEVITEKPTKKDKYIYLYNNSHNGGLSHCVDGNNTDSVCNVLHNCAGWACGRFNHIYNLITGYVGIQYPDFNCNAENFIDVAKKYNLKTGTVPKAGAIMVWMKGATLNGSDGAGHVAIVEKVISKKEVYTSESGWSSAKAMWCQNRTKGSDGNWGMGTGYTFKLFIYNPAINGTTKASARSIIKSVAKSVKSSTTTTTTTSTVKSTITSPVSRDSQVNQIYVKVSNLNVRISPSTSAQSLGYAKIGYYDCTGAVIADGYTWYKIATDQWVAHNTAWTTLYPYTITTFKVGDKVRLKSGATSYGTVKPFPNWIYNSDLYIRKIENSRVVISIYEDGAITGAVDKKYLNKV